MTLTNLITTGSRTRECHTKHQRHGIYMPALCLLMMSGSIWAQDTRRVLEPVFPATCAVIYAPLQSTSDGPAVGPTADEQNNESSNETGTLQADLANCPAGQAVELALPEDSTFNAFLINPITLPKGVSLIIDGGVTVYGSRDPGQYQDYSAKTNASGAVCGTIGPYTGDRGCLPLISLAANSGIYGFGIIDGQGNKTLLTGTNAGMTWWEMSFQKKHSNDEQGCPKVINAGSAAAEASNIVLYKFTIRNPPFHTVGLGGNGFTVWGVKIQAPWSLPNTDGFDIHGTNMTFYDTTVANGDQEIAIDVFNIPTTNITVNRFHGYSKGGITILAGGDPGSLPISDLLFENVMITGDLPSVVGTTVNGVPESTLMKTYGLQSYGQALPNATGELKALQITTNISATSQSQPGNIINNATYKSVCIQDIAKPINITPIYPFTSNANLPTLQGITFQDVHVLAPTSQFPAMNLGIPVSPAVPGTYQVFLKGFPPAYMNGITLDNVVFDDIQPNLSSLGQITAQGNIATTQTNVYPALFNQLNTTAAETTTVGNTQLNLEANTYDVITSVNSQTMAYQCSSQRPPFTVGELYASIASPATGSSTNLQQAHIDGGGSITLNAVVQPVMSQTTFFNPKGYNAKPGLLAVGSPALTNAIVFYEDGKMIGTAQLSANGTLASLTVDNVQPGTHTFTARYSADPYYDTLDFGSVIVNARWPFEAH